MKCPHGCKGNLKNIDDYPRTPKGLYTCRKCECIFRNVATDKNKTVLALVTTGAKCLRRRNK